ncbi:hypothetical protein RHGRI_008503 [Rhododendron griersonianum]|uniref:Leucine-rich repeat-containing N-terminal plant-type domain-containing protein n=1 Tax=Rhododendron griersonianum TaxID=479676 RepID=A0AAV6L0L2_9ERIC|nr:hypothetical protein RHGRI_008503 [Rhododendron griersonianum]
MMAVDISLISVPKIFLLFLIIVTLSVSSSYGNLDVPCLESEKHALLSFKKGLADPSNRLSSWDVEADCCTWAGVVCDNLTGHVRELHLQNPYDGNTRQAKDEAYLKQKLGGEVNPSLLNLKHLNYLDLSRNDFGGIPIPTFLGSLTSLRYLNLSESRFAGTVPHQLGNLSSLRSLGLKGPNPYGFQGGDFKLDLFKLDVENLDWLCRLSTLEYLDLSQVKLNKTPNWLQVINKLPSLVELRLSRSGLDRMPTLEKVNFTSLAFLDLSGNEFNGLIPRWIFSLSSLVSLNLAESHFEGPLPDSFWNLTSLRFFDVSYNSLNSTLPNSLWTVDGLVSLNLRDNGFEGPISSGLQNMTNLRELDLSENFDFNSSIPNWIYSFRFLEVLDLHSTLLHGTLSSSIANLTSLVTLDIAHTKLRGRVPREMGNLCNLRTLLMSGSKIEGDISELFESLSGCISYTLVSLWCDGCQLSGHLTDQLEQFKSLGVLYLGGNSLSGLIPVSLGRIGTKKYRKGSNKQTWSASVRTVEEDGVSEEEDDDSDEFDDMDDSCANNVMHNNEATLEEETALIINNNCFLGWEKDNSNFLGKDNKHAAISPLVAQPPPLLLEAPDNNTGLKVIDPDLISRVEDSVDSSNDQLLDFSLSAQKVKSNTSNPRPISKMSSAARPFHCISLQVDLKTSQGRKLRRRQLLNDSEIAINSSVIPSMQDLEPNPTQFTQSSSTSTPEDIDSEVNSTIAVGSRLGISCNANDSYSA